MRLLLFKQIHPLLFNSCRIKGWEGTPDLGLESLIDGLGGGNEIRSQHRSSLIGGIDGNGPEVRIGNSAGVQEVCFGSLGPLSSLHLLSCMIWVIASSEIDEAPLKLFVNVILMLGIEVVLCTKWVGHIEEEFFKFIECLPHFRGSLIVEPFVKLASEVLPRSRIMIEEMLQHHSTREILCCIRIYKPPGVCLYPINKIWDSLWDISCWHLALIDDKYRLCGIEWHFEPSVGVAHVDRNGWRLPIKVLGRRHLIGPWSKECASFHELLVVGTINPQHVNLSRPFACTQLFFYLLHRHRGAHEALDVQSDAIHRLQLWCDPLCHVCIDSFIPIPHSNSYGSNVLMSHRLIGLRSLLQVIKVQILVGFRESEARR
mmetsp:Transcript_3029/g.3369  ORF Transcript_3029/g.3369 Transcript_3029/m.3369 type:complete len:373 (-) Transcript_3029:727-1845(-)